MPRIDPSRLLKCLTPLLDPNSGAIKSDKEVDKIYGLMSKFSKKLVSKCTYINILKASNAGVLDLFMQRGGWEMIHGWTVDATSNKNHALLNEIASLLIHTPASIHRLKENDLPRLIKTLSKDCENEVTRELAKKVVTKWISIAKHEDIPISEPNKTLNNINASVPTSHPHSVLVYNHQGMKSTPGGSNQIEDQSLHIGSSSAMETENQQEFDSTSFDIGNTDLNDISDFNPEDFSKTIDQHLGELQSESTTEMATFPTTIATSTIKTQPATPTVIQTAPKITIRTVGGQTTVLNPLNTTGTDGTPYCLVTRDGKHFLMKLKLADQTSFVSQQSSQPQPVKLEDVTKQINVEEISTSAPAVEKKHPTVIQSPVGLPQTSPNQNSATVTSTTTDAPTEKRRRPRKDPSIAAGGNTVADGIRTYGGLKKSPTNSQAANNGATNQLPKPNASPVAKAAETEDSKKPTAPAKKKSSSQSSKSAAAAAAAKQAEEEAKLREKIKKEKQMMKQRQKDAKKQQQEVKDQETLKKLNLSSGNAHPQTSGGMKIPKIPKKVSSFSDAIGIPGATEGGTAPDKISRKKEKTESSNVENKDVPVDAEPVQKPEDDESQKQKDSTSNESKQRKHRVKVYNSKTSRADDLLKDMTENLNTKVKPDASKDKEKAGDPKSISGGKPTKRPSIEGITKPGDMKKPKLSDEKLDKEKIEKKKEEKEKEKLKMKEKEKPKSANTIKESSAFMDMLNASTESQKTTKKKRRLSSSGSVDKEKDPKAKDKIILSPTKPEIAKPVFNFYRDTLADTDELDEIVENEVSMEIDDKSESIGSPNKGAFTPQNDEGKLKSALCIHRGKNKPKKSVRWREEQELKEFHYFEMDETERVNVTKQNTGNRDFTTMKQHEKAEEKLFLRRKIIGEQMEGKSEWRKLIPVIVSSDTPFPVVDSKERLIQEARENTILGLFLPPGSILPDSASEPDLVDTASKDKGDPKSIPNEDVAGVTKVCDHTNLPWPLPQGVGFQLPSNIMDVAKQFEPEPATVNNFNMVPNLPVQMPNVSFPPVQAPPVVDYNNPWNNPFSVPVPTAVPPPAVNEWNVVPENFGPFGNPNMNMPPPNMPFGMNPYAAPPPMGQDGFNNFNTQGQGIPGGSQGFGNTNHSHPPSGHSRDQNYSSRGGSGHSSMRGRGGGSRDFERDRHKDYRGGRDKDRNHRDRDHRDDWDRGRDRDRDHRERNRDRDRDHHDRDYREHDRDRSRGKGKKEVLCRFFKRGYCQNGTNCEFLHTGAPQNNSQYFAGNKDRSSHNSIGVSNHISSGFSSMQSNDFSSRSSKGALSPSLFEGEDPSSIPNMMTNSSASSYAHQPPSVPSSGDDDSTRFSMPPSSPTNELFPPGTEPAKVIPVYSID